MTIRENARLQGFPDYYKLFGPVKERYVLETLHLRKDLISPSETFIYIALPIQLKQLFLEDFG